MTDTDDKIRNKINSIKNKILKHNQDIMHIQSDCEHNSTRRTHRANTGNYCRGDDIYWIDCVCLICDKHWQDSQR